MARVSKKEATNQRTGRLKKGYRALGGGKYEKVTKTTTKTTKSRKSTKRKTSSKPRKQKLSTKIKKAVKNLVSI